MYILARAREVEDMADGRVKGEESLGWWVD